MHKLKKPKQNYTVIPNEILSVLSIKPESRLLYIYLLSKPENWEVKNKDIRNIFGCCKDKAYKMMAELKSCGLLSYQRIKDGGGVYTLHEITTSVNIGSGFIGSVNNVHIVSTERAVNTKREVKSIVQNEFARWWAEYPTKVSKKKALAIWKRIKPNADVLIADVLNRIENDDQWKGGYIPHPTTYLNGERWNDEIQKRNGQGQAVIQTPLDRHEEAVRRIRERDHGTAVEEDAVFLR